MVGQGVPQAVIRLMLPDNEITTHVDQCGNWRVLSDPLPIGGPYQITCFMNDELVATLEDVLSGDVWLASGQSNMEWTLAQFDNLSHLRDEPSPWIRAATIEGDWQAEPQEWNNDINWFRTDNRSGSGRTSAVGYAFARTIQQRLIRQNHHRPIGIICNALGGSFIESWLDHEVVLSMPEGRRRADMVAQQRRTIRQTLVDSADDIHHWLNDCTEPAVDTQPWRRPPRINESLGWISGNQLAACWNTRLFPLKDIACKGVIWYQGESNADCPEDYEQLFRRLVAEWRLFFNQPDLPFYAVQLAGWSSPEEEADGKHLTPRDDGFPALRQAQFAARDIPHTGLAAAVDLGHRYNIHPADKLTLGQRLAVLALNQTYQIACDNNGPQMISAKK